MNTSAAEFWRLTRTTTKALFSGGRGAAKSNRIPAGAFASPPLA
jgi:hypothetical protein